MYCTIDLTSGIIYGMGRTAEASERDAVANELSVDVIRTGQYETKPCDADLAREIRSRGGDARWADSLDFRSFVLSE